MDIGVFNSNQKLTSFTIITIATFFFLFLLSDNSFFHNRPWLGIGTVIGTIPGIISLLFFFEYTEWRQGIMAEKVVTDTLRELDDSYYLFNDIVLPGRRGNLDHIVFGPTGIFLIETKSYSGEIKCDGDNWWQEDSYIHSFSRQLKQNCTALRRLIKRRLNEDFWVEGIVALTNPKVKLELKHQTVAVLRPHELCDFIRNLQSLSLSSQQLETLGKTILKYAKKM